MASGAIKLVGYILPPKTINTEEESENDEGEDETVPEFLDMKEMDSVSSGGFMSQQCLPSMNDVDFMFKGKTVRVKGQFPLTNPWWEISCSAMRSYHKLVLNGFPSYKLRTDPERNWRSMVSLFLKECQVDPFFVTRLMEWLPVDRYVDLVNIEEVLYEFGREVGNEADYARTLISASDAGFHVRAATIYPGVMKYLPQLLPGKFLDLLKKGKEEEKKEKLQTKDNEECMKASPEKHCKVSLLARLEDLIKSADVWKFGFGYIMNKEFRLVRCETKLKDFKSCELFSKMSPEHQDALIMYSRIKDYCSRSGHTYIDLKILEEKMEVSECRTWRALDFLRGHGVLMVEKRKIALRNLYKYEKGIADCLLHLTAGEPWTIDLDVREVLCAEQRKRMKVPLAADTRFSASQTNGEDKESEKKSVSDVELVKEPEETSISLDPDQVQAAEMMCANPVTVISGKGGCGKTTVVSVIFKAAMERQEKNRETNGGGEKEEGEQLIEVLLTAPTGRAASLLTKKTCFTAYTIHQVLWSFMLAKKCPSGNPLNWKFAKVRVLVVDEGSLVCVQILSSILSMLTKHAQLQKFIILGDIRQLPSIEPGNVLNDLFNSLKKVNWAIEMRTNHRAESELIVQNAGLIASMGSSKKFYPLNYDATVDLGKTTTLPSPDKSFIEILLPKNEKDDDLQNSIKHLLKAPGLQDHTSSQFIAFRRDECSLINELCCKFYSNHNTKTYKNKMDFRIDDKVCCTRNGYVTNKDKEEEEGAREKKDDVDASKISKERLCNGEIFFIKQDVTTKEDTSRKCIKSRYLTLDNMQGKKLTVDYRELMKECKLRHSWARTIHTFQGSEEKTIVYVLDGGNHQTWKHVYTAVTRGQNRVYVITKPHGLESVIQRHVIKRNTRLEGRVMDFLRDLGIAKESLTQPNHSQFNTPKRDSGSQNFQSTQEPFSSPGQSQVVNNMTTPASGFRGLHSARSSPGKRERTPEGCNQSPKQTRLQVGRPVYVGRPVDCSKLQAGITPRKLFAQPPQSHQDQ